MGDSAHDLTEFYLSPKLDKLVLSYWNNLGQNICKYCKYYLKFDSD